MIPRFPAISTLVIILTFSLNGQAQDVNQALREEIRKFGQAEVIIPYPGRETIDRIGRTISITSVREGRVYITLSKLTVEWFLEQKFTFDLVPRSTKKGIISASDVNEAMQWQTYPTYTQYDSIMRKFATDYPSLCRLDTIGTSIDGRLILAVKISNNVGMEEKEPQVFYSSTMHGDETGGFILMLRLADYLLKNYSSDMAVKNLVDNLEIWINPLANPDGTYTSGNTVDNAIRYNANGVDLNRNFPDPLNPNIVPEKETTGMVNFMKSHRFVISANFHAGNEVVNYPWDRWSRLHADDAWFVYISRAYADTVHKYAPAGYLTDLMNGITNGWAWYQVIGGRQDYITWEREGREVTIELDYTKMTPAAQLDNLWQYNRRSLLGYIGNALYGIHGKVKDAISLKPVPARVYIKDHDKDSSSVHSDSLNGGFTRLLMPGSWNLSFSAIGYRDTTITGIIVPERLAADMIVYLEPLVPPADTTRPYLPFLWPNPATSAIKCVLPEKLYGNLLVTVVDETGRAAFDFNTRYTAGEKLVIDVSRLPAGSYYVIFRNLSTGTGSTSRIVVTGRFN